jgi:hypothetical protein
MSGTHVAITQAPSADDGPHIATGPAAESTGTHAVVMEANPDGIVNRIASTLSLSPDREAGE